jgi:hypothetical protein
MEDMERTQSIEIELEALDRVAVEDFESWDNRRSHHAADVALLLGHVGWVRVRYFNLTMCALSVWNI